MEQHMGRRFGAINELLEGKGCMIQLQEKATYQLSNIGQMYYESRWLRDDHFRLGKLDRMCYLISVRNLNGAIEYMKPILL